MTSQDLDTLRTHDVLVCFSDKRACPHRMSAARPPFISIDIITRARHNDFIIKRRHTSLVHLLRHHPVLRSHHRRVVVVMSSRRHRRVVRGLIGSCDSAVTK